MKSKQAAPQHLWSRIWDSIIPDRMRMLFVLILGTPLILGLTFVSVTAMSMSKTLPSAAELSTVKPRLATRVFDDKNEYLTSFYVENREWVSLDSIPDQTRKRILNAIIETEDRKFYDHWGMNLFAIPVAVLQSVIGGERLRGASTLTQQLAKNLFLSSERSVNRKIKEAMASVLIERAYSKDEILELYINQVYMGAGCYGFQAASKYYFGKPLQEVTVAEAALLAGMLKKPEGLRPDRFPKDAKERRDLVLKIMLEEKVINKEEYQDALSTDVLPVSFKQQKEDSTSSIGAYFVEEVRKQMQNDGSLAGFNAEGMVVQTTLNRAMQSSLEEAVKFQLDFFRKNERTKAIQKFGLAQKFRMSPATILSRWDEIWGKFMHEYVEPDRRQAATSGKRKYPDSTLYADIQAGAIMIENKTGAIKAMVGGYDFNVSKFNRATQAIRQPGSSFKPFAYSVAIQSGMNPNDMVADTATAIPDPEHPDSIWKPANDDFRAEGMIPMRRALYYSKNLAAVNLVQQIGPANVMQMAQKFGLTHPMEAVPAIALGVFGVTVQEMASAFTVFPNLGYRMDNYYINSITTNEGNIIRTHTPRRYDGILNPADAYLMLDMLKDVSLRGTAGRVAGSGFRVPNGGKTGTTNDFVDGWYVGFTADYTLAIWVGYDDSRSMGHGYMGAYTSVPIWIKTMYNLYYHKGLKQNPFPPLPPGLVSVGICAESHKSAVAGVCRRVYPEIYRAGHGVASCNPASDHAVVVDTTNPFLTPISDSAGTDESTSPEGEDETLE